VFRRANSNRAALNRLLEMTGAMAASPEFPPGFAGDLLRRYKERLVTVRGLAAGTVRKQLALTRIMLTNLQVQRAGQLVRWTPELIERYVSGEARRYQPSTGQNIACATRSFLRFILQEGLIRRDLSAAVPSFAHWRLGPLPKTLRKEELAQLIKAADVRTPMGLRNRAMFLCMTELGMRASDVAGLELNGVDLTARVLRLHRRTRM
jgi:site-specific recombinase XerD